MAADTPSLVTYLEESARRWPDRVAVVDPSGRTVTYAELDDRATRVAGFLRARGVEPGDRVGVIARKCEAVVTALFGVMKAGAAYVPADYTAPVERNRRILSDCAVKVAFLDAECLAIADEGHVAGIPVVPIAGAAAPRPGTIAWDDVLAHAPLADARRPAPADLAYILYTSGSTGIPKGVILTHENATSFVDWCSSVFAPVETDRFSSHAPFHFDLSVLDIYVSVKHGAALYLIGEGLGKSPKELAQFIAASRLTMWYSTPSILALLMQFGDLETLDCSALRVVNFAGEVFPVKHLRALTRIWPHPQYFNLYGPTETNVCTFARIPLPVPEDRTEPYPIGPLCSHCRGLVLDADLQVVPAGGEGLLHINGPSVFQGYWNRPTENAAAFISHHGERWYNTGDVVREDPADGYIYVGRRDRMVKRRGYRIELGEIERALYGHQHVREAAVIAVPDEASGVRILSHVAFHPGVKASVIEMKTFCGRSLPPYMSPDVFVFHEALPRTSTDKVDYQSLKTTSLPAGR